ncbi:hypothetical protein PT974_10746 [Cladobotryum mycophilum]|uniref:Centrosomin N-terminal motif 1 domain-containing protein n=1 Tax=Cladobotryum mycophilum TaxID=491253 RepID=A0ABR0SBU4_9HYPO
MDAPQYQGPRGPRPPYPRASSRSSTSTVNTRMTSQSANSLTSVSTSPQLSNSHPTHRFHHASCPKSSSSPRLTPRHTPQLSREGSMESTRQTAVSAFLQEKLQRERRAEGERMGHSTSLARLNTDMSGSMDLGRALDSPMRTGGSDSPRPRSSAGGSAGAEPAKKHGLGLMEMEHVLSKLHKQNFDLKLELFHRREKQTSLETQVETLESDKRQMEEINDNLLEELDKRDKAVEEAVAMIVMLEAKVEQLVTERNMVHQIEQAGFFCAQDFEAKYETQVPEISIPDADNMQEDVKGINRMPSFLSEKTENTENLRNVYLGVRGSALSLSRSDPQCSERELLYECIWQKGSRRWLPPPIDKPLSLDGVDMNQSMSTGEDFQNMAKEKPSVLPARAATANPFTRGSSLGPFSSMSGMVGHEHSQQYMERPQRPSTTKVDGRRGPQPPPTHTPGSQVQQR